MVDHVLLIAVFVVRPSERSEFVYSARRLKPKELSSIDFPRTKISPFLVDIEHHYSTWPI